jgi:23S rRNA (uracil1939-C5)-methyltransferase
MVSRVAGDRLEDTALTSPSPERVSAPCRHFGTCGGCTLQHADRDYLARWKEQIIAQALAAHGIETEIAPTLTSPDRSRRRSVLSGRRTKKSVIVGFHGHRSDTLVSISDCHVLRPEIVAALPLLGELTRSVAPRTRPIRLAVSVGPAGLDVDLQDTKPLDLSARQELASIARQAGVARLSVAGEPVAQERPPFHPIGPARVVPPPGAFLQATAEGEASLISVVRRITAGAFRIVDLFAGCGTFSLPLAEGAEVHAVEGDAAMLRALGTGWRTAAGLRRVTTAARDLFRRPLLGAELAEYDAAVIDPPRAGAEAQTREIAGSALRRIAFVSCNPATVARDAAILISAGFRLAWVRPIDQFLWSGHVELVGQFDR